MADTNISVDFTQTNLAVDFTQSSIAVDFGAVGISGLSGYSGSGISGWSGYSGESGGSGYSGYSGYSGESGTSGFSGETVSGWSGSSGTSGWSGTSGLSGYAGASGTSGYIAKFTGTNTLADSPIYTDGTKIGIGLNKTGTAPQKLLDLSGDINITQVAAPPATFSLAASTGGSLDESAVYKYWLVYVTADGDTNPIGETGVSITLGVGENAVDISNIPVSVDPRVTGRRFYRSIGGGGILSGGSFLISNNTATTYKDTIADGSLSTTYGYAYRKDNTTMTGIFLNNTRFGKLGVWNASFGYGNFPSGAFYGYENFAFGKGCLTSLTTGYTNTAIGAGALGQVTTGNSNIGIGYSTGLYLQTGSSNIFIGGNAGRQSTYGVLHSNTGVGAEALGDLTDGNHYNVGLGFRGGHGLRGLGNISIGYQTGYFSSAQVGHYNILIGYQVASNLTTTASNNIIIGYDIDLPTANGSNQLNIGNLIYGTGLSSGTTMSTGNVGIGISAPTAQLHLVKADSSALTDFLINPTVKSSGNLIDAQVGGSSKFYVNYAGSVVANGSIISASGLQGNYLVPYGDTNLTISTRDNTKDIYFSNDWGTTKLMTIDGATGNVGIGTTAPDMALEINHATGQNLRLTYNDANGSATTKTDMTLDSAGEMTITSPTDKTVVISPVVWDDLLVPVTSTKAGVSKEPGFAVFKTNGAGSQGVFTYWFDKNTEEELYFSAQLPHSWAGTAITPHVHWIPKTAATGKTVEWGLEYTWVNINGTFSDTNIVYTKTTTSGDADYVAGKHYMSNFAAITPGEGTQDGISSMILCRIFRNATDATDDTYEDDAGLLEIDFHYAKNTIGSRTISTK